ncbi:MAG: MTH938/NDUFAF3 family protein [Wenzhouxiangellaceae bacterium]|nr:MTH938/NDUFAF3 family protein [Wenzhouxiangellaceae bacterium]
MQLTQHDPEDRYYVHSLSSVNIQIVETLYSESLLLTPDLGVSAWPAASIESLDSTSLEPILDYRPDILLLASGRRMRFPDRNLQIELLRNNIGLEVMTLDAAARTFNVLADEHRRVMAALIWEDGPT